MPGSVRRTSRSGWWSGRAPARRPARRPGGRPPRPGSAPRRSPSPALGRKRRPTGGAVHDAGVQPDARPPGHVEDSARPPRGRRSGRRSRRWGATPAPGPPRRAAPRWPLRWGSGGAAGSRSPAAMRGLLGHQVQPGGRTRSRGARPGAGRWSRGTRRCRRSSRGTPPCRRRRSRSPWRRPRPPRTHPPALIAHCSTARSAKKKTSAPAASPMVSGQGPAASNPPAASWNEMPEMRAPAPNPRTSPSALAFHGRITPSTAPISNDDAEIRPRRGKPPSSVLRSGSSADCPTGA